TTGTPGNAGAAPAPSPTGGAAAPASTPPAVRFGLLKATGRKATLKVTVSGGAVSHAKIALLKGTKRIGAGSAATLEVGVNSIKLKLAKKLKKGRYTLKLTGTAPDGSPVSQAGTVFVRH